MIKSNSTDRTTHARRRVLAASLSALAVVFALAAASIAWPGAARTQGGGVAAKPREVKFGVKQGDSKTDIKLVAERGELTKVTATDPAGTRSLKRIDKIATPCKEADMVCKTVETEEGLLVGVCYCRDTQTALLLPAIQAAREAARSNSTNKNTNTNTNSGGSGGGITKIGPGTLTLGGANATGSPHVKVFSGATGAELTQRCWGDEKLKLIVCPQ